MSGTEAKQRLVDLDVGEVSIVDVPANEEPFVVTKAKTPATTETSMGVQLDPLVAANVTFQTLQDMMWQAGQKLREGKSTEAMADMERITAMLDQVKQFTATVTKAATDIAAEVTKAKGEDKKVPAFMKEALKGAIDTLKAAMGDDEETEEAKTEKALQVILKAGKAQFSKERMAKLHEAFVHMGSVYKEADAEAFQKAVEAWGTTAKAEGATETAKTETKTETAKADAPVVADAPPAWFGAAMEGLKKSLDEVKETTQAVTKRVETIEKSEAVSKSLGDDRDDNPNKVVKAKQPSIFKGIL